MLNEFLNYPSYSMWLSLWFVFNLFYISLFCLLCIVVRAMLVLCEQQFCCVAVVILVLYFTIYLCIIVWAMLVLCVGRAVELVSAAVVLELLAVASALVQELVAAAAAVPQEFIHTLYYTHHHLIVRDKGFLIKSYFIFKRYIWQFYLFWGRVPLPSQVN